MIKTKIALVIFIILFGYCSNAQSLKTLDQLEESYQACLDKGINMLGCSEAYYLQMDSMLNVVYKQYRAKLNSSLRSKLKTDQIKWLSSRDNYFKNIILDSEEQALSKEDKEMVIIDKKAQFVRDRVIELLKKCN